MPPSVATAASLAVLLLSTSASGYPVPRPRTVPKDGVGVGVASASRLRGLLVEELRLRRAPSVAAAAVPASPSPSAAPARARRLSPAAFRPAAREDAGLRGGTSRRDALRAAAAAACAAASLVGSFAAEAEAETGAAVEGYRDFPDWTGTSLPLLSPREAASLARRGRGGGGGGGGGDDDGPPPAFAFPMGRWPDPILRRPASPAPPALFGTADLRDVAAALRDTARAEGAVGLAAQQCGVDVRLVWLDDVHAAAGDARRNGVVRWLSERRGGRRDDGGGGGGDNEVALGEGVRGHHYYHDGGDGLFLANPRIVRRSPELDVLVWTERCLVLPPSFSAPVLRDAAVDVEYETLEGETRRISLGGELARACQHEMDHDRGILITDHVGLEEMESEDMRGVEREGHDERMGLAYARAVDEPSVVVADAKGGAAAASASSRNAGRGGSGKPFWEDAWVPPARADDGASPRAAEDSSAAPVCDEECLARRRRIVEERRAMMRQSRSSTSRQDVFELSRQRAALYNSTYQGASCPPGVPCL